MNRESFEIWQSFVLEVQDDASKEMILFLLDELMSVWEIVDAHDVLITDIIWDEEELARMAKKQDQSKKIVKHLSGDIKGYKKEIKEDKDLIKEVKAHGRKKEKLCSACKKSLDRKGPRPQKKKIKTRPSK